MKKAVSKTQISSKPVVASILTDAIFKPSLKQRIADDPELYHWSSTSIEQACRENCEDFEINPDDIEGIAPAEDSE